MNPIVILWAHPRSMSTALERVMRERGDFDCLHEPFLHYYYLERTARPLPHFVSREEHPRSFAETRDLILEKAESAPVFAKDMSYYVMPEIFEHGEFCRRVRHCFLIRNPLRSIVSYYRLDPGISLREVGLEAQWQHYCRLLDIGIVPGPVLEAETVQRDTAGTMRRFWQDLGLDYRERALEWERDQTPADWEYVEGWHRSVSASGGIRGLADDDAAEARRELDELCLEAPQLRDFLDHHQPFYRQLRHVSLQPRGNESVFKR